MADSAHGRILDRAQISMWEDALRPYVEDLLAVLPEVLAEAAITVLAYELARAYSPPERRASAATPDAWTALLAAHVETLFPDADDAAAVTDFLAGALALEFDPPRRIGPRRHAVALGPLFAGGRTHRRLAAIARVRGSPANAAGPAGRGGAHGGPGGTAVDSLQAAVPAHTASSRQSPLGPRHAARAV